MVFGTLLGPEATGSWFCPFGGGLWVLFVSGFLAASIMRVSALAGCVCGVCGTGLLFENYIVDASIFYKKQFPRYMNLDLSLLSFVVPFGVWRGGGGGFHGSLERIAFY